MLYPTLGHCRGHYDMQPLMDFYPAPEKGSWALPVYYDLLRRGIAWAKEPALARASVTSSARDPGGRGGRHGPLQQRHGPGLPILEAAGWRLAGAFVQRTGRLNTVIDLWELEDFNHYDRGIRALTGHVDFAGIAATLAETVRNETIVFADRAPYMR